MERTKTWATYLPLFRHVRRSHFSHEHLIARVTLLSLLNQTGTVDTFDTIGHEIEMK